MPSFSTTRMDAEFGACTVAMTRWKPSVSNPCFRTARAASVAKPCPQDSLANRQPTSAPSLAGTKPQKPMTALLALSITGHRQNPRVRDISRALAMNCSVRSCDHGAPSPTNCMTRGSEQMARNGSRSVSVQSRKNRRSVSSGSVIEGPNLLGCGVAGWGVPEDLE